MQGKVKCNHCGSAIESFRVTTEVQMASYEYDENSRKYVPVPFPEDPYDWEDYFYCDECGKELSAEVVEALERLME